jgi:hypothetical protein
MKEDNQRVADSLSKMEQVTAIFPHEHTQLPADWKSLEFHRFARGKDLGTCVDINAC